jgi:hypothetical protein
VLFTFLPLPGFKLLAFTFQFLLILKTGKEKKYELNMRDVKKQSQFDMDTIVSGDGDNVKERLHFPYLAAD